MKKNKVILTRTGEAYTCKYLLDAADVVDTKVEIQIRTMAMDFWASLEHRIYYKKGQNNETLRNELRQCAEVSAALDLRMQSIRKELDVDD